MAYGKALIEALIAARKEFKPLVKNKVNPHFKSKYADLSAVCDSVDEALAKYGLTYVQPLEVEVGILYIATKLMHTSGEEMVSKFPVTGGKPQEMGSAITYGRRFSLCSLLGISADDDDDANGANGAAHPESKASPMPPKQPANETKKWAGIVVSSEPMSKGSAKFMHIKGADGFDLIMNQPSDKAHLDLYNMICADLKEGIGAKVEWEILYSDTFKGNIVQSLKQLKREAVHA